MLCCITSTLGYLTSPWIFVSCAIFLTLYLYFTWHFKYWESMQVPYLPPTLFFGNVKDRILLRKSFSEMHQELYNRFEVHHLVGGIFEGRRPMLILRDPEIIKNIMVRDFDCFVDRLVININPKSYNESSLLFLKGTEWRHIRQISTPIFTSGKIKAMSNLINQCTEQMVNYLHKHHNGKEMEMKEFFGRFTLDVIASCAFGIQCDSLANPDAEFVKIISKFNNFSIKNIISIFLAIVIFGSKKLAKLLNVSFMTKETVDYLANIILTSKQQREREIITGITTSRRTDFLQLMLDAQAGRLKSIYGESKEISDQYDRDAELKKKKNVTSSVMTDEIVVGQCLLFLLAGYETSSTLLSFASYELALNPDVQERARTEVHDVLSRYGGHCCYEALADMSYLENVLNETLRKHPPVARVERVCTAESYHVEGTNAHLRKGDVVVIPIRGLHYDPRYYPEPETFNPDRFLQEWKYERSHYVYLPFGCGPRNCIGRRFAMMSSKMAMATLLNHYSIETCKQTEIPIKINKTGAFLKSAKGIFLTLKKIE